MRTIEPARWDDYVLTGLLLLVALPRCILAVLYDHPFGVEGSLSMVCVVLALAIIPWRRPWR